MAVNHRRMRRLNHSPLALSLHFLSPLYLRFSRDLNLNPHHYQPPQHHLFPVAINAASLDHLTLSYSCSHGRRNPVGSHLSCRRRPKRGGCDVL